MNLNLHKPDADIFIPDQCTTQAALARTTHLAIGAHQDDLEIFAYHGIAACYRRQDNWFCGITVTNGAGSPRSGPYAEMTDEAMQQVRLEEQRQASAVGQYGAQLQLRYSSAEVKDPNNDNVVNDLINILKKTRPAVIYTHNPFDKHDTHVAVLLNVIRALRACAADFKPEIVYGCEVWRSLDWVTEDRKVALVSDQYPNLANTLLGVFDSQISGGKRYDLATIGRRLANATYHESHATDQASHITWAVDLTSLILESGLELEDYAGHYITALEEDVAGRIRKLR